MDRIPSSGRGCCALSLCLSKQDRAYESLVDGREANARTNPGDSRALLDPQSETRGFVAFRVYSHGTASDAAMAARRSTSLHRSRGGDGGGGGCFSASILAASARCWSRNMSLASPVMHQSIPRV